MPLARLPVDPVTIEEAAAILGCSVASVRRRVLEGRLPRRRQKGKQGAFSRAEVEELATEVYDWRRHVHDATSYWVTTEQAVVILGVVHQRVRQLAERDLLPYLWHRDGIRLFGREQLEVVAQGRSVPRPHGPGTRRRWRHGAETSG